MQNKHNNKAGFTIIEVMTSVSIFIIVVTTGIVALLNVNSVHNKSQNMRSIMDNMNFIMEDISRNLRTGYNYRCINSLPDSAISTPSSGNSCLGIAFEFAEGDPSISNDQWVYKIDSSNGTDFNISKSTDGGSTWVQLNPPEVLLEGVSGFSVLGAEPPPSAGGSDLQQPFATIILVGDITYKSFVTPFSLQTSVSQRAFDI
ncbi:hypothetical protein A2641_00030 [Candidatus Nomurabacteria bacterium RIFCSPHIGHO2_01_FULL_37_25]|uniref:Prepilin-type N-terminal cleavage/methylation domain-containing protein n=1 Tax=Candidatus Nomurabacteria bacterium RIFCSPLOWO2_01_FULL_36_16 TaxID=1801767 RepID=A0A1F6WY90_9BACT|nr:MAG: hypothetical protein A2641_00030 [Candidatus Nomurabacteria bacterium RIFCSPHIGHO2_01_FULL_37_25]OGI75203.1 MAG: hypothetical protein A3D36_03705 [Candidatus Nomurabacteria bacterium RIFCSPHIGHO2_02_FULL_36_29]OGI86848.1 MAG: hypothetical protein A3A91_03160 [Candidatus Nomurabacteria bacterium RIFCSPLOWO2_01_FULL_36_16]OGI95118.1 MAG: hypothetical protein A3I84_01135 [Candidatus Nomurabacteria bacterium RIFCSPLOWO2_02_FULL_36_8]